jgi:predicted aspartyl protease
VVGPGTGLTVSGSIDGHECNLTVDTGSDISIVHPDILQDQKVENLQPVTPSFRTVTGQKEQMKGSCNLTVRIGSTKVSRPIWVADIQDPCILGTDLLEPLGCVVNLKDSILLIGDEEVPLQRIDSRHSSPPCYRAVLDETVNLPPHSESLVPVKIEGLQSTKDKWGILEPSGDGFRGVTGVVTGRTLVDLEQPSVPVRVLNLSEKEQRIKSGVVVAVCASVQSVLSHDVGGTAKLQASP